MRPPTYVPAVVIAASHAASMLGPYSDTSEHEVQKAALNLCEVLPEAVSAEDRAKLREVLALSLRIIDAIP